MTKRLKPGDLAVQDCRMPYPNAIYRVEEVDEHGNFRGVPVFRLLPDFSQKKSQWLGYHAFRKVEPQEIRNLVGLLKRLL